MYIHLGPLYNILLFIYIIFINTVTGLGGNRCPLDYIVHNNYCYYFSIVNTNWASSQEICETHGSTLSSITNTDELDFLIRGNKSAEFSLDTRYL